MLFNFFLIQVSKRSVQLRPEEHVHAQLQISHIHHLHIHANLELSPRSRDRESIHDHVQPHPLLQAKANQRHQQQKALSQERLLRVRAHMRARLFIQHSLSFLLRHANASQQAQPNHQRLHHRQIEIRNLLQVPHRNLRQTASLFVHRGTLLHPVHHEPANNQENNAVDQEHNQNEGLEEERRPQDSSIHYARLRLLVVHDTQDARVGLHHVSRARDVQDLFSAGVQLLHAHQLHQPCGQSDPLLGDQLELSRRDKGVFLRHEEQAVREEGEEERKQGCDRERREG